MNKALAAIYLIAASVALATDLGGDGLGGPSLQPRAQSAQLGEPGIANRELSQVDPVLIEAGEPALDFRFAKNKSLIESTTNKSSLITFSRSAAQSPGTYVGSDGLIKTAAVNNLLYSEQFDNGVWIKTRSTISANQITAPDGKQTADYMEQQAGQTLEGRVNQNYNLASGTYTFSVYAKAAEKSFVRLTNSPTTYSDAFFDLSGCTTLSISGGTISSAATSAGNGWCRLSFTVPISGAGAIYIFHRDSAGSDIVADSGGIYIWGAQLEEGTTATPYIHTTSQALAAPRFDHDPVTGESLGLLVEEARTNLIAYSEDFSNVAWSKTNIAYYPTTETIDPAGQTNAYKIDPSLTPNSSYSIFSSSSVTGSFSVFLKEGTERYALVIRGGYASGDYAIFDLQSGTITQSPTFAGSTATIVDAGNGWYRCSIISAQTTTINAFSVSGAATGLFTASSGYVYIYGAQLEESATFSTSYIPTEGSAQTRYADVAAVQDEDFATQNLLSYSESFDVGWTMPGIKAFGAGSVVNAIEAPDGQITADLIIEAGGTTGRLIYQNVSATGTLTWSFYVKSYSGNRFVRFQTHSSSSWFDLENGVWGTVASGMTPNVEALPGGWYKISLTGNPSGARYAGVGPAPSDGVESYAGDNASGFYVWGASLTATEYPVEYTTTRNLLTDSQDFERGSWVKETSIALTNDTAQAPDGTNTADRATWSADNRSLYHSITTVSGEDYVASIYVKGTAGQTIEIQLDGSGGVFDRRTHTLSGGWDRVERTITTAGTGGIFAVRKEATSTASTVLVWGAQLEPGTTATEYVRTVDVVGKAYNWYEPTEGTLLASGDLDADISYQGLASFNSSFNSFAALGYRTTGVSGSFGSIYVRNAGADQMAKDLTVSRDGFSVVMAMAHNDGNFAADGTVAVVDTTITVPIFEWLQIGYKSGFQVRAGHIKRLTYWPRRQSDSTLQVITQ